jgi:ABC-type sugar transport system substrate-binding protein
LRSATGAARSSSSSATTLRTSDRLIHDGKIFGTVDQDPYPQAYNAMKMAWLHFNGKDVDIQKPYFLPLPLITKENAEKTPAAWGC